MFNRFALVVALSAFIQTSQADELFNLQESFVDGTTFFGSFEYNTSTNMIDSASGTLNVVGDQSYALSGPSYFQGIDPYAPAYTDIGLSDATGLVELGIAVESGSPTQVLLNDGYNFVGYVDLNTGTGSGIVANSVVPEPALINLLFSGGLIVFGALRRKIQQA